MLSGDYGIPNDFAILVDSRKGFFFVVNSCHAREIHPSHIFHHLQERFV